MLRFGLVHSQTGELVILTAETMEDIHKFTQAWTSTWYWTNPAMSLADIEKNFQRRGDKITYIEVPNG